MGKPAKKKTRSVNKSYSVVKFEEAGKKLFDCIPDIWFNDEEKTSCFWPPKSGKSFKLRALNYESPEDFWEKVPCSLVSDGYSTYSSSFDKVREKCSQKFNTSSADEQMEALNFRRKHPALTLQDNESFEHLFSKSNQVNIDEPNNTESDLPENRIEKGAATTKEVKKTKERQKIHMRQDVTKKKAERKMEIAKWVDVNRKSASTSNRCNRSSSGSISSHPPLFSNASPCVPLKSSDNSPAIRSTRSHDHSESHRSRSLRSIHSNSYSARSPISKGFASHSNSSSRSRSRSKSLRSSLRTSSKGSNNGSHLGSQRYRNSRQRSRSRSALRNRILEPRERFITSNSPCQRRLSKSNNGSASRYNTGSHRHRSSRKRSRSGSTLRNLILEPPKRPITSESPRQGRFCSASRSNAGSQRHRNSRNRSSSSSRLRAMIPCERSVTSNSPRPGRLSNSIGSPNEILPMQANSSVKLITELFNTVKQNNADTDRRLTRIEVTINKVFLTVAEMKRSNNLTSPYDKQHSRRSRSSHRSRSALSDVPKVPKGFKVPSFPIRDIRELSFYSKNLKKEEFRDFMLKQEKEFCVPANTSNNVVMIAYFKRFISLELRSLVALVDKKRESKYTLYGDFRRVYDFLIDVMKSGFRSYNKRIRTEEIHIVLRTIWGRTNQMLKEKRRKSKK